MSDVIIEKAASFEDAQRLYGRTISTEKTSKFDWLYAQNPAGKADVYHAVDKTTQEVVGVYAIYPMSFTWYGEVIEVGQAFDAVVLPEYRGQGIFNRFLEFSAKDIQNKYKFMIGFPNHLSRGVLYRAGWLKVGELETYSLPLTGAAFGKKVGSGIFGSLLTALFTIPVTAHRKLHLNRIDPKDVALRPMSACADAVSDPAGDIQRINPVSAARTQAFVEWRMLHAPVNNYVAYELSSPVGFLGYAVLRRSEDSAELVDLVVQPDHAAAALKVLAEECLATGADSLHLQVSSGSYLMPAIEALGAKKRKKGAPVIFYPLTFNQDQVKFEDWFLTHADTDWV